MSNVILKNVKKIYPNGFEAVKDFNIEINKGEFIVFVGPSGCGKSTTLNMIAGLEDITDGSLVIDGKDATNLAPKERDIAFVFQNYALYSHMTVYHNMAFSLMLRRFDTDIIHEKVTWAAELLGLTPYLNRKPAQLSGGQRQRVALGRAIVRDPKVFLLDEPLSNLDAKLRVTMRKELKELHEKLNATMIYVTHDQIEALTLANRIVIMDKGYVKQIGTPQEVYTDPANVFVATFIGSPPMNIFNVKVLPNLDLDFGALLIKTDGNKDQEALKKHIGEEIILGVRPEHIKARLQMGPNKRIPIFVKLFELLGSDALIHIELTGTKITVKEKNSNIFEPNDKIDLIFDATKLYFFDKDTKDRIY